MWKKEQRIASSLVLLIVMSMLGTTVGLADQSNPIMFAQDTEKPLNHVQEQIFVNAAQMGYVLNEIRPDGSGYVFAYSQPSLNKLKSVLQGSKQSTDDLIGGDVILSGNAVKGNEGKVRFATKAFVMGYAEGGRGRVYQKFGEISIPSMGDFMKRMGADETDREQLDASIHKISFAMAADEIRERINKYAKKQPHLVKFKSDNVLVLRNPVDNIESIRTFIADGGVDDRFSYLNIATTATVYISEKGSGASDIFYVPGIVTSKQTPDKKKQRAIGFPGALRSNQQLASYYEELLKEILGKQ